MRMHSSGMVRSMKSAIKHFTDFRMMCLGVVLWMLTPANTASFQSYSDFSILQT